MIDFFFNFDEYISILAVSSIMVEGIIIVQAELTALSYSQRSLRSKLKLYFYETDVSPVEGDILMFTEIKNVIALSADKKSQPAWSRNRGLVKRL